MKEEDRNGLALCMLVKFGFACDRSAFVFSIKLETNIVTMT
jgi:hypothetical protein